MPLLNCQVLVVERPSLAWLRLNDGETLLFSAHGRDIVGILIRVVCSTSQELLLSPFPPVQFLVSLLAKVCTSQKENWYLCGI
jgi:hypothetical protein